MLALLMGCGQRHETVSYHSKAHGTVTLNGVAVGPLTLVVFSTQDYISYRTPVDKHGKFLFTEPLATGWQAFYLEAPESGALPAGIPPHYFIDTSSGLRANLQAGDNEILLELKK